LNGTDDLHWRRTSPFAVIFYLGKIYQLIAQNLVQTFAPLVALMYAAEGNLMAKALFGGSALLAFTIIAAFLRFWFFRYCIADNSILIREGVIRKTQLDIKFDRIQAINTQQNFVFRFFDLVTVNLDTAGSAKQEGSLPAIKSALADSLQDRIRRDAPGSAIQAVTAESDETPSAGPRSILRLGAADMVRIGLSSNRALIFLAFLAPLFQSINQDIEETIEETIKETIEENAVTTAIEASQVSVADGVGIALLVVVGVLLFLAAASITGAFLRYYGFKLVTDEDVFRSTGGLLTRHEHSVNFSKIQSVFASQNPVLRIFRRLRVSARQASSGKQKAGKHFLIPLCKPEQLAAITREIFGEEFTDADLNPAMAGYERVSPRYFRSRLLLTGILPALFLCGIFSMVTGWYALVFLAWIPLDGLIVWTIYRKYGYRVVTDGMLLRRGFLGFKVTAFTHRKVQRVSVTQTFSQQRKGLATMRVYLASGSVHLPYIDFELAKGLRDYMLYRVESSELAWH
jgi:putative membrane protein